MIAQDEVNPINMGRFPHFQGHYSGPFFHIGTGPKAAEQFIFICMNPPSDMSLLPLLEAYVSVFNHEHHVCLYVLFDLADYTAGETLLQESAHLYEAETTPDICLLEQSDMTDSPQALRQLLQQPCCLIYYQGDDDLPATLPLWAPEFIVLRPASAGELREGDIGQLDRESIALRLKQIDTTQVNIQQKLTFTNSFSADTHSVLRSMNQSVVGLGLSPEQPLNATTTLDNVVKALRQLPPHQRFCLVGFQCSAYPLYQRLEAEGMLANLDVYFDDHPVFNAVLRSQQSILNHRSHLSDEPKPDWVIVYVPPETQISAMRFYLQNLAGPFHILLPYAPAGYYHLSAIESATPILVHLFPCVGTSRLIFPLDAFFRHFQWTIKFTNQIFNNHVLLQQCALDTVLSPAFLTEYYVSQLRGLDFYQYTFLHDYIDIKALDAMPWLRKVVLIRDPRDVVTSFYFREFVPQFGDPHMSETDKENHLLELLENGFLNSKCNYALKWPNICELTHMFVAALEAPHTLVIKFEDLHHHEAETYRKLLSWLGFSNHPFLSLTDQQMQQYVYLGSFEHQTGGQHKRGGEDKVFESQGNLTSCRKGVTGDWMNHFSPKVAERCQELIGPQLKQLGY